MRPKTQQRALRVILASLMGSDLSVSELRELANGLPDPEFAERLSDLLEMALLHISYKESKEVSAGHLEEDYDLILEAVQRRRLAKRDLISILRDVSMSSLPSSVLDQNNTTRQILERFLFGATPMEIMRLKNVLHVEGVRDRYLKGIVER